MGVEKKTQYFSHLNGLVLSNNWGDMINLLDTCLVNGLTLPTINSVTIDEVGDVYLTFASAHKCMLFQLVKLNGFNPSAIDGEYRIKGIPSATQLILKAGLTDYSVSTNGTAALAPLGYDLVFTGINKRVYRSKDPTAQHPFIRIDETISDGTNSYTSTYAKYAMVGLIENMTHIDDFEDTSKLQLPLDTTDLKKNWKITGTGASVVRGWSKWYWASYHQNAGANNPPAAGNRNFTFCGDKDAFYLFISPNMDLGRKTISGCGIYESALLTDTIPAWFLFAPVNSNNASTIDDPVKGRYPLLYGDAERKFVVPNYNVINRVNNHIYAVPILPDNYTGMASAPMQNSSIAALEIPFYDESSKLRGTLKHVCYAGNNISTLSATTPMLADSSMYVADKGLSYGNNTGGVYFYLGELE